MQYPLPSNDPLGKDLKLDDNGDIVININGDLQTVTGADNVAQAVRMQLTTNAPTYIWSEEVGSILAQYVDVPITDEIEREIKNIVIDILNRDDRIVQIQSVLIDDSTPGQLIITPMAVVEGVGEIQIPIKIGGIQV